MTAMPPPSRSSAAGETVDQAYEQQSANNLATEAPMVESNSATEGSNGLKRPRDEEDEDEDEVSPAHKRARKDENGIQTARILTLRKANPILEEFDVKDYTATQMRKIQKATHKIGELVDPTPPAEYCTWKTDTHEQAKGIADLVVKHRIWELVGRELRGRRTRAELKAAFRRILEEMPEEYREVEVQFTNYMPIGKDLHTAMPEGEGYDRVNPGKEYAWNLWTSRTSFIQENDRKIVRNLPWYWVDGPGLTQEAYDSNVIGHWKNEQIVKWMGPHAFPMRVLDTEWTFKDARTRPSNIKLWSNFAEWKSPATLEDMGIGMVEFKNWKAEHEEGKFDTWKRQVLKENTKKFEWWQRQQTLHEFMAMRRGFIRRQQQRDEQAIADLERMPPLFWTPIEAKSEPLARRTRTTAAAEKKPWPWPKKKQHPEHPALSAMDS
jgi:hypothetical protein